MPASPSSGHTLQLRLAQVFPAFWLLLAAGAACIEPVETPRVVAGQPVDEGAFVRHHADLVLAIYSDALAGARGLAQAVASFVDAPTAAGLVSAREAWRRARKPYLQSEAFRFYEGPIDAIETLINAWPIDERYIDAVLDDPKAGIVQQPRAHPKLSWPLLAALNEKDGEKNISTGFHAVEFLLWGQDTRRDGAGQRPHTDYLPPAPAARRRGQYLRLTSDALVVHLEKLVAAWSPEVRDNFRASLLARPPREATASILRGVGTLSGPELAGERLTVAYETKDQENEHSCFSDTTHEDVLYDLVGIKNVCTGTYLRSNGTVLAGPGLCDVAALVDPAAGAQLRDSIAASLVAAKALRPPFDQAILGKDDSPGRITVKRVITAVEAQTAAIARVAAVLDIRLSLPVLAKARP